MKERKTERTPKNSPQKNNLLLRAWLLWEETSDLMDLSNEATFNKVGLPFQQYVILVILNYVNFKTTVNKLAHLANRKPNSISMIINRMERDGLVKRTRSTQDKRVVYLTATTKGKMKLKQSLKPGWEYLTRLFSCFNVEELHTLIDIVEKLQNQALKELPKRYKREEINIERAVNLEQSIIKSITKTSS